VLAVCSMGKSTCTHLIHKHHPPALDRTRTSTQSILVHLPQAMSFPSNPSQVSMSSTLSSTSTATLAPPPKDYESAFGNLTAAYGTGGAAPAFTKAKSSSKKSKSDKVAAFDSRSPSPPSTRASKPKNFEAAFGALSASLGLGSGAHPSSKT